MSGLGDQIAVLDGLAALDPSDGRIGQTRAAVDQYGTPIMPGVLSRKHVIDPSEAANYSGGSSYAPGIPLMPSSVGLAGGPFGNIPSVLPTRRHVIDYSGGANYSGGSDWVPGLPLTPSSAGLADAFIKGGYGRAGLGAPYIQGGYGRAGLGQTASYVDEDLAGAMEAVETAKQLDPGDGRIGQRRAQVDEYGKPIMPGVLARSNVIDPSEAANYSGGSSYAPGIPLMPSSVGLAGLDGALAEIQAYDDLDAVKLPTRGGARRIASEAVIRNAKKQAMAAAKRLRKVRMTPKARQKEVHRIAVAAQKIARARQVRRMIARGGPYAVRGPQWAR
jgi:hypothetical protein